MKNTIKLHPYKKVCDFKPTSIESWSPKKSSLMAIKGNLIDISNILECIGEKELSAATWRVVKKINKTKIK